MSRIVIKPFCDLSKYKYTFYLPMLTQNLPIFAEARKQSTKNNLNMDLWIILLFTLGYIAITLEDALKTNKAAIALITGVLCWTLYILKTPEKDSVVHALSAHMGEIAQILFFLLGAMVTVELIDAHEGFEIITDRLRTTHKRRLLWLVCGITFFLSAMLDNLTTTIVIITLLRKLMEDRNDRLLFTGLTVLAANAGGAWSPMGDVTTTMLWTGGQISALNIVKMLFLPSLVSILVPVLLVMPRLKGAVAVPALMSDPTKTISRRDQKIVLGAGLLVLLGVPIFKTITHLPPFMGMLLGLGLIWVLTEYMHTGKSEEDKAFHTVVYALRKVDSPSILFFLGILIAVASLQSSGVLIQVASWLNNTIHNPSLIVLLIGLLSAIVDNVPLVAAAQGMYSLEQFPMDHYFWEFF
jgi:Na+/H+ antiporter NhaD/arsenite permease-like protein